DPMFDLVDDAVHDCAVRELSPAEDAAGGYGSADNQHEAVYALRFCYRDSDAPLVARMFATMDDPHIIDIGLIVVQRALETDPHLDDGLLDALYRFATDTGLADSIRRGAILCAYASA